MKKILSAILCLVLLACSTSALAATVTATGDVYLRSGPGLDYGQITALESGNTAAYLGSLSVDDRGVTWYKVFYNNKTGWVSSKFAELDTWTWSYGYVTATGNVWVRSGPGLNYAELGALENGDTLEYRNDQSVDSRGVTWYKVYYGSNNSAWISSKYAKLTSYGGSSYDYVTATGSCNVRAGAGLGYDSLAVMWTGDTASYLGSSSTDSRGVAWYKVNYGGVIGWVSSAYGKLNGGASSSSGGSWSSGTVSITGDVWLRTGPGLDYDEITNIGKGATATYLGNSSVDGRGVTWYKIQYKSHTGWVSSRFAKIN